MFVAFFIQRCVMRFIYTVVRGIIFFSNIFCRGDTLTGVLQNCFVAVLIVGRGGHGGWGRK